MAAVAAVLARRIREPRYKASLRMHLSAPIARDPNLMTTAAYFPQLRPVAWPASIDEPFPSNELISWAVRCAISFQVTR
jgi:hypothetical protein